MRRQREGRSARRGPEHKEIVDVGSEVSAGWRQKRWSVEMIGRPRAERRGRHDGDRPGGTDGAEYAKRAL